MEVQTLESRLAAVELTQIKRLLVAEKEPARVADWEKIFGTFANSEHFDEAVHLGREYREAQFPKDDE